MNTGEMTNAILNVLMIFATVLSLWIAARILPRILAQIPDQQFQQSLSRTLIRLILWVALGSLLTLPLRDALEWIANWVQILVLPTANFSTSLGLVPAGAYVGFLLVLMTGVYGLVFWTLRAYPIRIREPSAYERVWIASGIASLIYRGIHGLFTSIFNLPALSAIGPTFYGLPGFFIEILIGGIIMLIVITSYTRYQIRRQG